MATKEVNNERKKRYFFAMGEIAYMEHIPLDEILSHAHPWRKRLEMGWEHSKYQHEQNADVDAIRADAARRESERKDELP